MQKKKLPKDKNQEFKVTKSGKGHFAISAKQYSHYKQIFERHNENGIITGTTALPLFKKSNLNNDTLAQIWTLSDRDLDNQLNISEFLISMHLVTLKLHGTDLPQTIPQELLDSISKHLEKTSDKKVVVEPSSRSHLSEAQPVEVPTKSFERGIAPRPANVHPMNISDDKPTSSYDASVDISKVNGFSTVRETKEFLDRINSEINDHVVAIQKQSAMSDTLREKHESNQKQLQKLQNEKSELQKACNELQKQHQQQEQELNSLNNKLKGAVKEVDAQQESLKSPALNVQSLRRQRKEVNALFKEVLSQYQAGKQEHQKLLEELSRLQAEIGIAKPNDSDFQWQDHGFIESKDFGEGRFSLDETSLDTKMNVADKHGEIAIESHSESSGFKTSTTSSRFTKPTPSPTDIKVTSLAPKEKKSKKENK